MISSRILRTDLIKLGISEKILWVSCQILQFILGQNICQIAFHNTFFKLDFEVLNTQIHFSVIIDTRLVGTWWRAWINNWWLYGSKDREKKYASIEQYFYCNWNSLSGNVSKKPFILWSWGLSLRASKLEVKVTTTKSLAFQGLLIRLWYIFMNFK